jgi:hypothetical protein
MAKQLPIEMLQQPSSVGSCMRMTCIVMKEHCIGCQNSMNGPTLFFYCFAIHLWHHFGPLFHEFHQYYSFPVPENSCHKLSGRQTLFNLSWLVWWMCFITCYLYKVIEKFITIFVVIHTENSAWNLWKFTQNFQNSEAPFFTDVLVSTLNRIISHYKWPSNHFARHCECLFVHFQNSEASSFTNVLVSTLNRIITHYKWPSNHSAHHCGVCLSVLNIQHYLELLDL